MHAKNKHATYSTVNAVKFSSSEGIEFDNLLLPNDLFSKSETSLINLMHCRSVRIVDQHFAGTYSHRNNVIVLHSEGTNPKIGYCFRSYITVSVSQRT